MQVVNNLLLMLYRKEARPENACGRSQQQNKRRQEATKYETNKLAVLGPCFFNIRLAVQTNDRTSLKVIGKIEWNANVVFVASESRNNRAIPIRSPNPTSRLCPSKSKPLAA
jgi:hypothetical protein